MKRLESAADPDCKQSVRLSYALRRGFYSKNEQEEG